MGSTEEEEKLYKRKALERIDKTDSDLMNFTESKVLENKFGPERLKDFKLCTLSHLYYYHYACESVDDTNWGCAWRNLQTTLRFQLSLNNQKKDISFYNLFMQYGPKKTLMEIYKKLCKKENKEEILNLLSLKEFAPFENTDGWAEPFISQLVLYDNGFEGDLILVNDYPKRSYAPKEVFDKTVDFNGFKEILKQHFSQENPAPIILDDSCSSIGLFGIEIKEEKISLMIMDPHATNKPEMGLYIITLDENGGFIQIEPQGKVLVSYAIYFNNNKPWMAYIPKTK